VLRYRDGDNILDSLFIHLGLIYAMMFMFWEMLTCVLKTQVKKLKI